MFYSDKAGELRNFIKDKLGFDKYSDVGEGWLIFDLPEADMGVHPSGGEGFGQNGDHSISFYCDDIKKTMAELKEKGVEFKGKPEDLGFGLVTFLKAPGDIWLQLYQPHYEKK